MWPGGRYLSNEEINVLLQEIIHLLPKDVLDLHLTVSLQVGGGLGHASSNQGVPLTGDFFGHVTGSLVDLSPLDHTWEWNHFK